MDITYQYVNVIINCVHCSIKMERSINTTGAVDYITCENCNKKTYIYFKDGQLHVCDIDPRTPAPVLIDLNFVAAMEKCFAAGNKNDRKPNDWRDMPYTKNTHDVYLSKILRHAASSYSGTFSGETKRQHLAAVACNANILWHLLGDNHDR